MKAALLTAALLAGCATQQPAPVAVPLPVRAAPPDKPARPALAVETLKAGAATPAVLEAYATSLGACVRYARALEIYIEGLQP